MRQHAGIDVAGDDVDRRRKRLEGFAGGDGQGIRLLSGRGGTTPDVDSARRADFPEALGQHIEMMRFTKERRQVGRERIHERLHLRAVAFDPCQIRGKTTVATRAQSTRQTARSQPPKSRTLDRAHCHRSYRSPHRTSRCTLPLHLKRADGLLTNHPDSLPKRSPLIINRLPLHRRAPYSGHRCADLMTSWTQA